MPRTLLPYLARVWVPTARADVLDWARERIVQAAGGLTETQTYGHWTDPTGKVVGEPVAVLEVSYGDAQWQLEITIDRIVEALLIEGEQAVLVEKHGKRYMVTA